LANFKATIKVFDSNTGKPLPDCKVTNYNLLKLTDNTGSATFGQAGSLLVMNIEKENYKTILNRQITIFSDTVLTFYLVPEKYKVTVRVGDERTGEVFFGSRFTLNTDLQITNEKGEVNFEVYPGIYPFLIEKTSYENKTGTLAVGSDTTIYFTLIRQNGSVKFKITEDVSTPVNDATVILKTDTLISTALGIANFKNLPVYAQYSYIIYKEGYKSLSGTLFLNGDTTVTLKLEPFATLAKDISEKNEIQLWPNPAGEKINVVIPSNFTGGLIKIMNLQGNIIKSFQHGQNQIAEISVTDLPAGIYLLKLISVSSQISRLFVKK
jgi:hypothetical protein